jgi:hypothetical protein
VQQAVQNNQIVFSCQKTSEHHFLTTSGISNPEEKGLVWLNSGVISSSVELLQKMLQEIDQWNMNLLQNSFKAESAVGTFNDQSVFGRFCQAYQSNVLIDTRCQLSKTSVYEPISSVSHGISVETLLSESSQGSSILHLPFTTKDIYVRYLEIASCAIGRDLLPHEIDLLRLKHLTKSGLPFSENANHILCSVRRNPTYFRNLMQQHCLRLLEKWRRKMRTLSRHTLLTLTAHPEHNPAQK